MQFPLPFPSELSLARDEAHVLIDRLVFRDLIAVIPVLARYAEPVPSPMQSLQAGPFQSVAIRRIRAVQAPVDGHRAG